jgi:uncharacterized hydrophobic protein (TIGR00271 family)
VSGTLLAITGADLARMRGRLLFDGPDRDRKLSAFWALLLLSSVIATAGVIADSTAAVIGAMIVAPLMTPILGTVLSVVTADARNLARCLLLVVTGAVSVVAISWAMGHFTPVDLIAETNTQVAGRVHPRLIDLVAALATGAVGSFALVRDDVSDTLPGVAIAISLVPPLAVVGLTLESGAGDQSLGALLLFLTNVGAILLSGLVVMAAYRVRRIAVKTGVRTRVDHRVAVLVVVLSVLALAVPLGAASERITAEARLRSDVTEVAGRWAATVGWDVVQVDPSEGAVVVKAEGPLPVPDPETFRTALDDAGLESTDVRLVLTPTERVDLPGADPSRG